VVGEMRQKIRNKLLMVMDIFLINISVMLAYLLRFDGNLLGIQPEFAQPILHVMLVATITKIVGFSFFKLYSSLWKYAGVHEASYIVLASLLCNVAVQGYIFIVQIRVPRSIFLIAIMTDIFLIGGARFAYRVLRRLITGEMTSFIDAKKVLVIGGGDTGAIIIRELKLHPELKSLPVAIIDSDPIKLGKSINGVPIVGNTDKIFDVIDKYNIDEIIIALPSASNKDMNEIFDKCAETPCKVKILPSVSQLIDESVIIQKIRDVDIEDLLGREPIKLDVDEITSYIKGNSILVTGGGGSIGSELCRQIASYSPKQLIILDNYENNLYDIQNELLNAYPNLNIVGVIANIREKNRIEGIFAKYRPHVVFHAAAHKHVPLMEANPAEAIKNNVIGTLNVAECADRFGVKRFVLISTDKAVNPTNIMGATKRIAEMIIQAINKHSKTEFVAVRFGNVLGSNGSVIPLFKKQIEQGGPVTVTHPEIIRYFMTIPEAVQLVMQAGAMAKGGEIFVLDMGEPVKIYDLALNLIKLSGFEPEVDIKIEFTGLRPGEKLYEELLMAEESLEATKNNKIFVAQPVFTDLALLKREIECLKEIIMENTDGLVEYIKIIVPTYKKADI
jgi:FlaA1/EpsC-like NDP-sugar epimerase